MIGSLKIFLKTRRKDMKYCFIINPASGKTDDKNALESSIREKCAVRGIEPVVMYTRKPKDAGKYILSFCDENKNEEIRFFACGGDGTLCEAVDGVARLENGENVSLGVVPVGTGNDFVRNFDGNERFLDIDAQLDSTAVDIDLMRCNDMYAINMVNIGFDCQVVVKTSEFKRKPFVPSKLAYIFGLVATLIKKPGAKMKVKRDGAQAEDKKLLLATFANGGFCGGGFHSNPNASLRDGSINALFVNDISRRRFLGLVGSYKSGTHLTEKNAEILKDEKAERYELSFDSPTNVSVDGEIVVMNDMIISCIPGAIKFLVPKGAVCRSDVRKEELATV